MRSAKQRSVTHAELLADLKYHHQIVLSADCISLIIYSMASSTR
jgi:hypothetical protein